MENEAGTYFIRQNYRHEPNVLISCCFGHSITMINTRNPGHAGSMADLKLATNDFRCRECEAAGRHRH